SPELAEAYGSAHLTAGLGRLHKLARRYKRRAFEIMERWGDGPSRARVISLAMGYAIGMGDWEAAVELAERGLQISKEAGDRRRWEEIHAIHNHRRIMLGDFRAVPEN